jgi:hypothetical protein
VHLAPHDQPVDRHRAGPGHRFLVASLTACVGGLARLVSAES